MIVRLVGVLSHFIYLEDEWKHKHKIHEYNHWHGRVPRVKGTAFKNSAVTHFWFNFAHIQPKCCKYIHSVRVPNYVTNFTYTLTFSNTATRNTMQTQIKIPLFCRAARFMIPNILNILPSMAITTVPKNVTSGNAPVLQFCQLSRFHLYPVSDIVLGLFAPHEEGVHSQET
jgi:hypothetical protein